jgi:hypothetical protein
VQYDYAFHVKGRLTPVLKAALDPLEAADTSAGTVLVANAADRAALHGFVARIEALGLNLVELQRIPAPDDNGGHRCLACGCRQGPEGAQRVRDRVAVARGTGLTTLTIAAAPGRGRDESECRAPADVSPIRVAQAAHPAGPHIGRGRRSSAASTRATATTGPLLPAVPAKDESTGTEPQQQVVAEPPAHAAVARGTAGRADGARPVAGRGEVQAGSAEHNHPLIRMHTRGGPPEAEEGDQSACESSAVPYAPGRLRSRPGSRWRPVRHPPCRDPRTERYRLPARVITY